MKTENYRSTFGNGSIGNEWIDIAPVTDKEYAAIGVFNYDSVYQAAADIADDYQEIDFS